MKIIVPVEVEIEGNDHPREWVEQCLEEYLDQNFDHSTECWKYWRNAEEGTRKVEVVSLRVVFPENT
jgi:hypothetical protein